jgi:hypothetical protein
MFEHEDDQGDEADRLDRVADAFVEHVMQGAEAEPRDQAGNERDEHGRLSRKTPVGAGRHPVNDRQHDPCEQTVDAVLRIGERRLEMAAGHGDRPDAENGQANEAEHGEDGACAEAPSCEYEQHGG